MSIILVFMAGCSSAPKIPQVSLTGKVEPINFHTTPIRNTVIKSQQVIGCWRKQFVYKIDGQNPSPEFFYAIAHADQIIAYIKSPSINLVFQRLQADLRRYGVATPVNLFIVEAIDQQPQIILDCIKLKSKQKF